MRMPAEWHPQSAIYLAWPCSDEIWPRSRPQIFHAFANLISEISSHTLVKLLCQKAFQAQAEQFLGSLKNIEFIDLKTDDVWCRDFGPIFVKDNNNLSKIINWDFNAWGGKFTNFVNDNKVTEKLAKITSLECINSGFVFEGGAIDLNGEGLGITTASVIYNNNRNPAESHTKLTEAIKKLFGLEELIILEDGLINDDTDGHVDNITRFFKPKGILTCSCEPSNPNYERLQANLEQVQNYRFADGSTLDIIELPLPDPLYHEGNILPASYANFLISNEAVFFPTFSQKKNDIRAKSILQKCFPNKAIIPIDSRIFLLEGGSIHCLSQQEIHT
jgi:agmatine deiminase